jgi:hypothetical protein
MSEESLFKNIAENGPEIAAYILIDGTGSHLFWMEHDMADDRVHERDLKEINDSVAKMREKQLMVIKSLTKYGLEPLNDINCPTEQYWKWYRWWNKYFSNLSSEVQTNIALAIDRHEDVSAWHPLGSWKD